MKTTLLRTSLTTLLLLPFAAAAQDSFNYDYFDVTYVDNGMDRMETAFNDADTVSMELGDGDGIGIRASKALSSEIHVFAGYYRSNLDLKATQTVGLPSLDSMRDAFMGTPDAENWDALCDLNEDGIVNYGDLAWLKAAIANGETSRIASEAATDGDMSDWRIGFGYNRMLATGLNGYAEVFWHGRDLDFGETHFMGRATDFGATDNGIGATLGLRSQVTERLQLSGRVTYTPVGDIDILATDGDDRLRDDMLYGVGGEFWFNDTFSVLAEVEGDGEAQTWLLAARYQIGG